MDWKRLYYLHSDVMLVSLHVNFMALTGGRFRCPRNQRISVCCLQLPSTLIGGWTLESSKQQRKKIQVRR